MKLWFLHGLESSSQGDKARLLAPLGVVAPDFRGTLQERMAQLQPHLADGQPCVLIGSSFGGLMAALWTLQAPEQVQRLILLAPALHRPDFRPVHPVSVPTLLIHGRQDTVVPPAPVETAARQAFSRLTVWSVDDDHRLKKTSQALNWRALLDLEKAIPDAPS